MPQIHTRYELQSGSATHIGRIAKPGQCALN